MNKEIKKASSLLDEKESKQKAIIAKAEADLKATEEKLTALNTALDSAEDAEQYKVLLQEIRDNEAVKEFCVKRIREAKASTLSKEEYNKIIGSASTAFTNIKADYSSQINAEIEKLTKLFEAYDSDVCDINKLLNKAGVLHNVSVPMVMNAQTIASPETNLKFYLDAYFRIKTIKELRKNHG